jgi:acyl transferase domain-containing protein/surfactin synthase thioesterase subunit
MKTSPLFKESIAIIGMSCRFPKSSSLNEFWELLKNGKDTITEIPSERWNAEKYYDSDPTVERKTNQRHASLLSDIHDFDPLFFNISPAEANEMSPSQKLMLELAWEAVENSTVPFKNVKGKNVGVYVGNIWTDFEHYRKAKNAKATLHSAVGMSSNVVANRVSFAMGFTGPSLVIDTGCSASLVALHLACQSLQNNEIDMSLVGGINHILDPDKYIELTQFGGLSVNGKCSTFDNDADGFVRGEGGGVLLLKRLSEAERDGDKILAVIRGTAVNNNGYNDTLPATSIEGQKALLEKVYTEAKIQPGEVHYVEAHGTGTKLGDPNEARAIGEFFRTGRTGPKLRIGSVKTNIGHTEATAGIAGLIKVVLAMQHKSLPPNLNFKTPNINIPFEELKLEVQKELSSWPVNNGETFKAGVNSFGWGGTNAHAVLEEYRASQKTTLVNQESGKFCLPLSAKSSVALKDMARAYADQIESSDDATTQAICIATALRKAEFDHRILFSGTTREQLLLNLRNFVEDETEVTPCNPATQNPKIVFVFPGQGGQWLGMGREFMLKEKVFREAILACDEAFRPFTNWSLVEQINASPETSRLNEINVIQPTICAMQIALTRLWMSWGISPQAVVGHSMGEVAAAYIAGALTLEDAAKVICTRSLLMKTVSGTGGAMAVTELSRENAEKVAARYPGKLSVAVNNSPKSTVLAGDKNSIDEVIAELEGKGLFCRLVKVDVASHSPQMDPLKDPLREALQLVTPRQTTIPFVSTVLNKVMEGKDMGADYWVSNLRGMVQFASVIEKLLADQHTIFIEANPHPVLVNAVNECADFYKKKITTLASLYREKPEQEEMMKNLGEFYGKGYVMNWSEFYGTNAIPQVELPPYPFQREHFEFEDLSSELKNTKEILAKYPLLGDKINLASAANTYYWESTINLNKFPYLRDHTIDDNIVLPVSCYIEIALEAITEIFNGDIHFCMEQLSFTRYITLTENTNLDIQVKLEWHENQTGKLHIFKKTEAIWEQLAEGNVARAIERTTTQKVFEQIEYHPSAYTEGGSYYNLLRSVGRNYGKHFQQLTGLDRIGTHPFANVLFSIKSDQHICQTSAKYKIHPALIASFVQPVFVQLTSLLEEGNHLDVKFSKIGTLTLQGPVNYEREMRGLLVFQTMKKQKDSDHRWDFSADITIANYDNTPVLSILGLEGTAEGTVPVKKSKGKGKAASEFLEIYAAGSSEREKLEALEQMITYHVSKIIKIAPTRIKRTMTFKGMGIDSLMAVQLRNSLEKEISMKLPVGMFWTHPNIQEYTVYVNDLLTGERQGHSVSGGNLKGKTSPQWFTIPEPNSKAAFRIFCFHDAGGSASLFDGWEKYIDKSLAELVLVEMPGRGRRLEETPYVDYKALIHDFIPAIKGLLDKPYVFLGHSMGGMVAFEITRELRRMNALLPHKLFISSTSGLNAYTKSDVDYTLSNEDLIHQYPHLHISNIGSTEMQNLLINILRADLQFLYNYEFTFEEPLNIPIIALHGDADERVKLHQMEEWEKETANSFRLISRTGGHRYIEHDGEFVAKLIEGELTHTSTPETLKVSV